MFENLRELSIFRSKKISENSSKIDAVIHFISKINVIIRRIELCFKLRNDLIYYTNFDNDRERLL